MAANVSSTGINNLVTLIKRLEAATSRLEDMATSIDSTHPAKVDAITSAAAPTPAIAAPAPEPEPTPEPVPRSIEDFDKLIDGEVAAFVAAAEKVDKLVADQAKALLQAFQAERTYLLVSTKAKKPNPQPQELLTDLHHATGAVDGAREANRASPYFPHLSAVSEGVVALGWIVEPRPADFVSEIFGGAQFYGNRVLKEYKEKDPNHVQYIQTFYKVFRSLIEYIKEYHKTGLMWNNKDGIDAMEALAQTKAGSAPKAPAAAGAPPPPPPPPPPLPVFDNIGGPPAPPPPPAGGAKKSGDMGAVFDELNKGSAITSHLRKVDKSEMTHKNPSLRASSVVPERSNSQTSIGSSESRGKSPVPSKKPKPESMRTKKPPKKQLEGSKWLVENFENMGNEFINIKAEISHGILITKCSKCVIKVHGKANAISIDNCSGISLIVDSLVSSIDVIKSSKFQVQIDGVVPTIIMDQVDGAQLYLSPESLSTEVLTSKCSSVNIVLPPSDEYAGDSKECALPEQLRTVIKDGQVVTEIVEHAG